MGHEAGGLSPSEPPATSRSPSSTIPARRSSPPAGSPPARPPSVCTRTACSWPNVHGTRRCRAQAQERHAMLGDRRRQRRGDPRIYREIEPGICSVGLAGGDGPRPEPAIAPATRDPGSSRRRAPRTDLLRAGRVARGGIPGNRAGLEDPWTQAGFGPPRMPGRKFLGRKTPLGRGAAPGVWSIRVRGLSCQSISPDPTAALAQPLGLLHHHLSCAKLHT